MAVVALILCDAEASVAAMAVATAALYETGHNVKQVLIYDKKKLDHLPYCWMEREADGMTASSKCRKPSYEMSKGSMRSLAVLFFVAFCWLLLLFSSNVNCRKFSHITCAKAFIILASSKRKREKIPRKKRNVWLVIGQERIELQMRDQKCHNPKLFAANSKCV